MRTPMKVYIAAMFGKRAQIRDYHARVLAEAGHEVTARWLTEDEPPGSEQASAVKDLADVARADAVVLVTNPVGTKYSGGGRHVEFGYALALGKVCITVGEHETIFQYLPQVTVCSTIGAAVDYLATLPPPVSRPRAMLDWCWATFGSVALDRQERAMRLLEEAMEVAQCEGITPGLMARMAHRTGARPPGQLAQEVGQMMNLLECLAENAGLDARAEGEREFARCRAVVQEEWDRRHAAKVASGVTEVNERQLKAAHGYGPSFGEP